MADRHGDGDRRTATRQGEGTDGPRRYHRGDPTGARRTSRPRSRSRPPDPPPRPGRSRPRAHQPQLPGAKPLPSWLSKPPVAPNAPVRASPAGAVPREVVPVSTSEDPSLLLPSQAPGPTVAPGHPALPSSTPSGPAFRPASPVPPMPTVQTAPPPSPVPAGREGRPPGDAVGPHPVPAPGSEPARARARGPGRARPPRLCERGNEAQPDDAGHREPARPNNHRHGHALAGQARTDRRGGGAAERPARRDPGPHRGALSGDPPADGRPAHRGHDRPRGGRRATDQGGSPPGTKRSSHRLAAEKESLDSAWTKRAAAERAARMPSSRNGPRPRSRPGTPHSPPRSPPPRARGTSNGPSASSRRRAPGKPSLHGGPPTRRAPGTPSSPAASRRSAWPWTRKVPSVARARDVEAGLSRAPRRREGGAGRQWAERLASERAALDAEWSKRLTEAQLAFDAAVATRLTTERSALECSWAQRLGAQRESLDQTWSERLAVEKSALEEEWARRLAAEHGALDEGWSKRLATEKGITDAEVGRRLKAVEDRIRGLGSLDDAIDRRTRGPPRIRGVATDGGDAEPVRRRIGPEAGGPAAGRLEANAQALQQLEKRLDERWKLLRRADRCGGGAAAARGLRSPGEPPHAQLDHRLAERDAASSEVPQPVPPGGSRAGGGRPRVSPHRPGGGAPAEGR